jgi:hypothetical protein
MSDLARTVLERHSTRMFLPRPVPRDLVNEAPRQTQQKSPPRGTPPRPKTVTFPPPGLR